MAGLTSSVASALSELSLSDVDLGSSVHSDMTPRRLSAHAHPTGEYSRGKRSWKRPRGPSDIMYMQEASSDTWLSAVGGLVPWGGSGEAGNTMDSGLFSQSVILGQALKFLETQFPFP